MLDPAGRGTYGVIVAVAWIAAALGHLSIEQAAVLRWQRGDDHAAVASTSFVLGLAGGSIAALTTWLVVTQFAADSFSASDRRLIAVVVPAVPLIILGGYLASLQVLDNRIGRVNAVRWAAATAQLLVLAVLWLTHRLTVSTAIVVWVVTLGALPVLLLTPGLSIRPGKVSKRVAASLFRLGLKYHLGMAALFLLRRVDTLMLNAQVSRREVGLYVVAVLLGELVFVPGDSIAQVVLPRQVLGSLEEAADYTARIARVNTIVALGAAAALAVASPLLIRFAFGAAYDGSIYPLLALLPGVVAIGFTRPITAILVRLDRPFTVSFICIGSLVVNVALNLVLIPTLGIIGASIASSVAYAVQAYAYISWLLRSTPLRLSDLRPTRGDLMLLSAPLKRSPLTTPAAP